MKKKIELWHVVVLIAAILIIGQSEGSLYASEPPVSFNFPWHFPEYQGNIEEEEQPSQDVSFNFPDISKYFGFPEWNETAAQGTTPEEHTGMPITVIIGAGVILYIVMVSKGILNFRRKRYM